MKRKLLITLIFISNIYAFEYFDYNYKTFINTKKEKKEIREKIAELRSKCNGDNMTLCYEAAFYNSALNDKLEYFFTKMVPDYCYKQKVPRACYERLEYFSKQFYPKYEVLIHDPNNLDMLYFGCEQLHSEESCEWLGDLFKRINNLNEAKKYKDLAKRYSGF